MKQPFEVNKILIPIDFSETALLAMEHAALMCKKFQSKLHLLHIYKSKKYDVLPHISTSQMDDSEVKRALNEELGKIADKVATKYSVSYDVEVRDGGNVAAEVDKAAKEANADLIMMGTHGVSGVEEFFIGSNAFKVVTTSALPVLTVQSHAKEPGYETIVVPIDSSLHTRDKVSQVATIAKAFDSDVHLVALITEDHEEDKAKFDLKIKQVEEFFDSKGIRHQKEEIHGDDIAKMTMEYAKKVNAKLIAIMTEQEARTGLFMGPYAQRIVNHSKISVLSVTPLAVLKSFSQSDLEGGYRPFHI